MMSEFYECPYCGELFEKGQEHVCQEAGGICLNNGLPPISDLCNYLMERIKFYSKGIREYYDSMERAIEKYKRHPTFYPPINFSSDINNINLFVHRMMEAREIAIHLKCPNTKEMKEIIDQEIDAMMFAQKITKSLSNTSR